MSGPDGRTRGPSLAIPDGTEQDPSVDDYDALQIGTNAEPETLHRVYRLLAQQFHPDNTETGNETRFRALAEAYRVLSDPEARARRRAQSIEAYFSRRVRFDDVSRIVCGGHGFL